MEDGFSYHVTVPADEWSRLNRRLQYVEAALVQAYRNNRQLKEWFSAADLLRLVLPGLPTSRQGLMRKANAEGWPRRVAEGRGGEHYEFHFSCLPRHAFEELIARIVAPPLAGHDARPPAPPRSSRARKLPDNAAPPWLLPLMRIVRSERNLSVDDALRKLATSLPPGTPPPDRGEVAAVFARLGGHR